MAHPRGPRQALTRDVRGPPARHETAGRGLRRQAATHEESAPMDAHPSPPDGRPIRGVVFDLHATLVHAGEPHAWVAAAMAAIDADPTLSAIFDPQDYRRSALPDFDALAPRADRIWEHARALILPRTRGTTHGLQQVLRLVG